MKPGHLSKFPCLIFAVILLACGGRAAAADDPGKDLAENALAGTKWRLVEFRSMDDAHGSKRPDDPSVYLMSLSQDGRVTMRLNCNRATGTWSAEPSGDGTSGRFTFGPLAVTRALCPPPSMDEMIAGQAGYVRGYLLRDGRLHLSLMADGGIFTWEPDAGETSSRNDPGGAGDEGPRNWLVAGVSSYLNLREGPSLTARVIGRYPLGTVLDNLGYVRTGERTWRYVQELGGGPVGYVAGEYLSPAVSPDGSVARGPDDSALRAGKGDFDARGRIPCAQNPGQPMTQCRFGVARAGGGYATVVVTRPDGRDRAIFFRMGRPVGADTSQADGYPEFGATKESDLNFIRIGDERYEIPDAVLFGG